jgi:hypothetical protein
MYAALYRQALDDVVKSKPNNLYCHRQFRPTMKKKKRDPEMVDCLERYPQEVAAAKLDRNTSIPRRRLFDGPCSSECALLTPLLVAGTQRLKVSRNLNGSPFIWLLAFCTTRTVSGKITSDVSGL